MELDASSFSLHRLRGEAIPDDLRIVVEHPEEFFAITGVELRDAPDWAPWNDHSYLSGTERVDPDIAANVRAISAVNDMIAYVAAGEDGEYYGYWRGPNDRAIAESPLVCLDNEGQFQLCSGSRFVEAVLSRSGNAAELKDWLVSVGAEFDTSLRGAHTGGGWESPAKLHQSLYERFRHAGSTLPNSR
jgi:hypothetical protein